MDTTKLSGSHIGKPVRVSTGGGTPVAGTLTSVSHHGAGGNLTTILTLDTGTGAQNFTLGDEHSVEMA